MKKNKKMKTKDFVFLAIITGLYFALYMIVMMLSGPLGAYGHAISPGIFGLVGGTIIYFIAKKLGKMWQFTILSAIIMGVFTLMGAGYIPWIITTIATGVIADLITSTQEDPSTLQIAVSFGIMQVGQALGGIVPVWFFVDAYRSEWIARGQTPEQMDQMIAATKGMMGVSAVVVTFVLAFIGAYIGAMILKKHFAGYEQ
ncbi:MAG: MptD family putative ECF transporter S component [Peptostreptococcaceae bacterium]|nr:MptD family putative ECF transporter S component [Peptostreptococcaceae bacterium]